MGCRKIYGLPKNIWVAEKYMGCRIPIRQMPSGILFLKNYFLFGNSEFANPLRAWYFHILCRGFYFILNCVRLTEERHPAVLWLTGTTKFRFFSPVWKPSLICVVPTELFCSASYLSRHNKIKTLSIYTVYLTIKQYVITYPQRFFRGMPEEVIHFFLKN